MASDAGDGMSLRIAVLVKQVPRFEEMALQADKRLRRNDVELELNPYCRRAVAKGVELARDGGGECIVFTLGPPQAEDCLREAIAWGADSGILITDPALAGSDTLATAKALAVAVTGFGPFDLVLAGRSSVDADTGQVGPELAQLLGLPFVAGVRKLQLKGSAAVVLCEQDDGWLSAEVALPAVMTCAERLCDPAKVAPPQRALVSPDRIRRLSAADLGPGPWGLDGSPTQVGDIQTIVVNRRREIATGTMEEKVRAAVSWLHQTGAMAEAAPEAAGNVADTGASGTAVIAVLVEPGRPGVARELLGAAARLAGSVPASVWAIDAAGIDVGQLSRWGADGIVRLKGVSVEEDIATLVSKWSRPRPPSVMLTPSTTWGREVASRIAASSHAGLIGDAVDVDILDGRLVGWKPAFGGQMVAAITATSPIQMATVRPGTLPVLAERPSRTIPVIEQEGRPASRVRHLDSARDDDVGDLSSARVVIGVGAGVLPDEYHLIDPLRELLDAQMGASRKVTDKHWLPHAKQIGITGRSISPALYVAIGLSGKFNHMIGVRSAGFVLVINSDPSAPVFDQCDIGIVGDWHQVLPMLTDALRPNGMAGRWPQRAVTAG